MLLKHFIKNVTFFCCFCCCGFIYLCIYFLQQGLSVGMQCLEVFLLRHSSLGLTPDSWGGGGWGGSNRAFAKHYIPSPRPFTPSPPPPQIHINPNNDPPHSADSLKICGGQSLITPCRHLASTRTTPTMCHRLLTQSRGVGAGGEERHFSSLLAPEQTG